MDFEQRHSRVETNGITLHVVTAGNERGRPVVLLHGFPEYWYGWRHQVPALAAAGYHVIVPDQRGYNLSNKPKGVNAYRIQELVADILGMCDHYGCEQISLVGHDWGAAVAWYLAINHPERIHRLVIMNVPHPRVMLETVRHSLGQLLKSWYIGFFQIPILAEWLLSRNDFWMLSHSLISSSKPGTFTIADIEEYKKAWMQPGTLTAMLNWYRAAFRSRRALGLKQRVTVPTLILWGSRDAFLQPGLAERSLEWCDQGRLVFYDDASHWVQHEATESINLHLLEFLI